MTLLDMRTDLEQKKGARDLITKKFQEFEIQLVKQKDRLKDLEEVQVILQNVVKLTQEEIQYHITEIVNLALETIFPDPYEFIVRFEMKRSQTEATFILCRDGIETDPMTAAGGGVIDVLAFALRVSLWALGSPKTRNTLVLDEPFRFVSRDLKDNVSKMLHEVSDRLELQMIIVTHEQSLIEHADKVFRVSIKKGISSIED